MRGLRISGRGPRGSMPKLIVHGLYFSQATQKVGSKRDVITADERSRSSQSERAATFHLDNVHQVHTPSITAYCITQRGGGTTSARRRPKVGVLRAGMIFSDHGAGGSK